jgi:DNA-directed RNA polymerase subunit M/transcription elongation factor TFIIS
LASHRFSNDFDDLTADDLAHADRAQRRHRQPKTRPVTAPTPARRPPRTEADQAFRCRKCKQLIGAPASGGRHRNHCPNCLHSLHVDLQRPGDRRSACGSLMRPRGIIERRNGEQMILHECLGCGKTQPTRVAADDNPLLLMRLEPIGLTPAQVSASAPEEETA